MRAEIFREKSERKDILSTFITHTIVLTELTFFDQISALQQRAFRGKFKKNDIRSILTECLECITELAIKHEPSLASDHTYVSIGALQVLPNDKVTINQIMNLADEKLYRVKHTTRNLVDFEVYTHCDNV